MAMQSSGQIKWSEIQSTHGGSNPINISEYYGKYYSSGGDRRPTSGEQKASYLFSTSPSVNGDWSSWGDWSSCSVSCGGGTQTRSRTCSNPSATYGGSDCSGSTSDSQSCNTDNCGPYEYNTNGNKIYSENSYGYWYKYEYDSNGNNIYYETSDGYWFKREYDKNGKEIYHEDSDGVIEDNR